MVVAIFTGFELKLGTIGMHISPSDEAGTCLMVMTQGDTKTSIALTPEELTAMAHLATGQSVWHVPLGECLEYRLRIHVLADGSCKIMLSEVDCRTIAKSEATYQERLKFAEATLSSARLALFG